MNRVEKPTSANARPKQSVPQHDGIVTGVVTARDGTPIDYLQLGRGPGLVLLHGAMESAKSHLALATALADAFTVYLPERRGWGPSGRCETTSYGIGKDVEDIDALLDKTGASNVFGVSSGGLIALEAARTLAAVRKVALYEPALLLSASKSTTWLPRFDEEMAQGKVAAALITSMKGTKLGPPIFNVIPRRLLESVTDKAMKTEDSKAGPGDVTLRMLAPRLHHDGQLLAEMTGTVEKFRAVRADVLLLNGSKGLRYLRPSFDALARVLPRVERVEFTGLDHGGSSDVSQINEHGKPEIVAAALRRFFGQT